MPRRDPKVVRAIQAASQRMLDGNPIEVEVGRLSVIALSEESGVARTRLNREYKEERDAHTLAVLRAQAPGEPTTPRTTGPGSDPHRPGRGPQRPAARAVSVAGLLEAGCRTLHPSRTRQAGGGQPSS